MCQGSAGSAASAYVATGFAAAQWAAVFGAPIMHSIISVKELMALDNIVLDIASGVALVAAAGIDPIIRRH